MQSNQQTNIDVPSAMFLIACCTHEITIGIWFTRKFALESNKIFDVPSAMSLITYLMRKELLEKRNQVETYCHIKKYHLFSVSHVVDHLFYTWIFFTCLIDSHVNYILMECYMEIYRSIIKQTSTLRQPCRWSPVLYVKLQSNKKKRMIKSKNKHWCSVSLVVDHLFTRDITIEMWLTRKNIVKSSK